ncbi:MAG: hypothetical protein JG759_843 [Thermoanaerobacter sp.]|jgi:hypothetical protein|nr:hypothetical protein [Thermoanaerobacter sp.]
MDITPHEKFHAGFFVTKLGLDVLLLMKRHREGVQNTTGLQRYL